MKRRESQGKQACPSSCIQIWLVFHEFLIIWLLSTLSASATVYLLISQEAHNKIIDGCFGLSLAEEKTWSIVMAPYKQSGLE